MFYSSYGWIMVVATIIVLYGVVKTFTTRQQLSVPIDILDFRQGLRDLGLNDNLIEFCIWIIKDIQREVIIREIKPETIKKITYWNFREGLSEFEYKKGCRSFA